MLFEMGHNDCGPRLPWLNHGDAGAQLRSEALHATAEKVSPAEGRFVNQARSVDMAT